MPASVKPTAPSPKSSHPAYEALIADVLAAHPDVSTAFLFGMPCLQAAGTAFVGAFAGGIAVKLPPEMLTEALALPGTVPFDPSGRGRPMKEWVVVTAEHETRWNDLTEAGLAYLSAR